MDRERIRATVVGLAVAGVVIAALFWFVDAEAVLAAIGRADPALVAMVGVAVLLWNVSWGVALWSVLDALDVDVSLSRAILYHAAAAFANQVTPLGQAGGEPVTAWLISRSSDIDYEVSLASVTSFDAIHLIPSLSFAAVGAVYILLVPTLGAASLGYLPVGIVVVAVVLPAATLVLWRYRRPVWRRVEGGVGRAVHGVAGALPVGPTPDREAVEQRLNGFVRAVERVGTDRRRLALAVAFSGLGWLFQSVGLWVAIRALSVSVPLYVPVLVVPIGATGGGLPTPGGLGGREAINVTLLTLLTGVAPATLTAAVTIHSVGGYLLTTGVGAAATGVVGAHNYE